MGSTKRSISLGQVIFVQVQKELIPPRRIARLLLRILFLGPHFQGPGILLQDTLLNLEIPFLTVFQGMIPSVRRIIFHLPVGRLSLGLTPWIARGTLVIVVAFHLTTLTHLVLAVPLKSCQKVELQKKVLKVGELSNRWIYTHI